jgi:hypothetical protein
MAPKGKDKAAAGGAGKGKGKGKDATKADDDKGGAKVKGAQQINVRHILCEKHARKEEVVAKLRDGGKFDEVAREMSEDKARAGVYLFSLSFFSLFSLYTCVSWLLEREENACAVQRSGDSYSVM